MNKAGNPPAFLRRKGFWIGIGLFAGVAWIPSELHRIPGAGDRPAYAAATAVLMAAWWFAEALPMGVTACAPLVLFPLLGVFGGGLLRDAQRAASPFLDAYLFLFVGGMMVGAAMEQVGLHRRIALHIMRAIGTDPRRLLLGMLVATATVSLWISNTATAVMMLPIARALMAQLEAQRGARLGHFGAALMLAVAYASNVGGIGTKIGTATNSIFCGIVEAKLGISVGFGQFLLIGLPFVILFIPIVWWRLWALGRADGLEAQGARASIDAELRALGPATGAEKRCAAIFLVAAALWIAGDLVRPWIAPHVPALWRGFEFRSKHYEAWVAMAAGMGVCAAGILSLRSFLNIPFATLLLLAGSFAMAEGIEGSGLGIWLAARLAGVADLPLLAQLALASASTIALSAVASNTATITVMLNVLPRSLPVLAAATIAASCDFALPAGTPPNAIVFGSGYIRLPVMMRTGAVLDLCAAALIMVYGAVWLQLVL